MTTPSTFQKRILAHLRKIHMHESELAHLLYPDFEQKQWLRGARVSAVSRALSALIQKKLVLQGAFDARGRYAHYFIREETGK